MSIRTSEVSPHLFIGAVILSLAAAVYGIFFTNAVVETGGMQTQFGYVLLTICGVFFSVNMAVALHDRRVSRLYLER